MSNIIQKVTIADSELIIMSKDVYDEFIEDVKFMRDAVNVHPDCVEDSEFADAVSSIDEYLDKLIIKL